jgi:hypothetical protein
LAVAVFYQTGRQEFTLLDSISAYYFTSAQAMFVGGLIGVGACMIALKGTYEIEDTLLNLGGIFAIVVAIVPTARSDDFRTAVRACREQAAGPLLTDQASGVQDCPTVQALEAATRNNVDNSLFTLLVLGGLALIATVAFALNDRRSKVPGANLRFLWGFGAILVLWGLGWVALLVATEWFVDNAHFLAASGLFACIFAVTVANSLRRKRARDPEGSKSQQAVNAIGAARVALFHWPLDIYGWVAWAMIAGAVVMVSLWQFDVVTLFWLEVVVALLFVAFWLVQTVELMGAGQPDASSGSEPPPAVSGTGR